MGDLISRQAAIKQILLCENHDMEHDFEFNQGLIVAMNAVEELPTAEPSTTIMKVEVGVDKESLRKAMEDAELTLLPAEPNHDGFLEFLFNVINPNEMEQYMAMYNSHPNCGASMEESE